MPSGPRATPASPPPRPRVVAAAALALASGPAGAQVWSLDGATLDGRAEALAARFGPVPESLNPIDDTGGPVPFVVGALGADAGAALGSRAQLAPLDGPVRGGASGEVRVLGVGTDTLTIEWSIAAEAYHACAVAPDPYAALGDVLPFLATIGVTITGVPAGTPAPVGYAWEARSAAKSVDESLGEDDALVTGATLVAAGVDLFAAGGPPLDVVTPRVVTATGEGTLARTAGAPWTIALGAEPFALAQEPGAGDPWSDRATAYHRGRLVLRLDAGATIDPCPTPRVEFSLDIGADAELSDPSADGDEAFDPGDVYTASASPPPGPINGALDDAALFAGVDPAPDPLAPAGPPNAAPVCGGDPPASVAQGWFDLDATDRADFDVRALIAGGAPIPEFPSACVWPARSLAYSLDDDGPAHLAGDPVGACETPTLTPSPVLRVESGSDATEDEVLGALLTSGPAPLRASTTWGAMGEARLHAGLAPGPGASPATDDDVDALDLVPEGAGCGFWYFSADHEAVSPAALDPGDVYLHVPGGAPARAIDDVAHLGLPDDVDLDAFELAFHDGALALLFSVDDDDPLTVGVDESGGLDPAMVYVSLLDGVSVALLDAPLDDDVDALAVYCQELAPPVGTGACCFSCEPAPAPPCPDASAGVGPACLDLPPPDCLAAGGTFRGVGTDCLDPIDPCACPADVNGDGRTDIFDFGDLASGFGTGAPGCATRADGDLTCDGVVDVFDFGVLASDFGCARD
jgi:hypothetical protein